MDEKLCPSCRYENLADNNFCSQCGSRLYEDNGHYSRLRILHGQPVGATFLLREPYTTLGRDLKSVIVLSDEQVSNKHAAIKCMDGKYWIEDVNSKNGVYVNGSRVTQPQQLTDRCLVKLGSTILRFEEDG